MENLGRPLRKKMNEPGPKKMALKEDQRREDRERRNKEIEGRMTLSRLEPKKIGNFSVPTFGSWNLSRRVGAGPTWILFYIHTFLSQKSYILVSPNYLGIFFYY